MYENEQYENVWRSGFDYFCRTRNIETKQVRIEKIQPVWEYYEKHPEGEKQFILDPTVKLTKKEFTNSKEAKEYRGLMESLNKEVFGGQAPEYKYIRDHFFQNGKNADTRIWFLDIETMSEDPTDKSFPDPQLAEKPVTQIQIWDNYSDKIIILSLDKMQDEQKFKHHKNLLFKHYDDEKALFKDFLKLLEKLQPTVITAWNGDYFDFPT
jgi:DNA polymerase elongation subunit (family B)